MRWALHSLEPASCTRGLGMSFDAAKFSTFSLNPALEQGSLFEGGVLNAKQKTVKILEDNTGKNLEYDSDILLPSSDQSQRHVL